MAFQNLHEINNIMEFLGKEVNDKNDLLNSAIKTYNVNEPKTARRRNVKK
jgi:hypothetical protein